MEGEDPDSGHPADQDLGPAHQSDPAPRQSNHIDRSPQSVAVTSCGDVPQAEKIGGLSDPTPTFDEAMAPECSTLGVNYYKNPIFGAPEPQIPSGGPHCHGDATANGSSIGNGHNEVDTVHFKGSNDIGNKDSEDASPLLGGSHSQGLEANGGDRGQDAHAKGTNDLPARLGGFGRHDDRDQRARSPLLTSSRSHCDLKVQKNVNGHSEQTPHKVQFKDDRRSSSIKSEGDIPSEYADRFSPSRNKSWNTRSPAKRKCHNRSRKVSEASSISSVLSNSSGTSYGYDTPDGGYGWVVVVASFFVNMIADGVTFSFGIMFQEFADEFDSSKAETAGVVSVFHAVPLLTGPLASFLTDRYGCRKVTILGSILASTGFFLGAFSHHITLLYLFLGVVAGFGLSLCYVAAIIIVAYYFDRKRSFATGISVCGSGVGTFLFAPLTQYLLDSYSGWRGACIILAGIFLNMCVCGMLFRELPWTKQLRVKRAESTRSLSSMPEIEELRQALQSGDVSKFLEDTIEEPRLTSSLLTIPTYIKNPNKIPKDVLTLLATNKRTYDHILHNFPDSLIAKNISEYALELEKKDVVNEKDQLSSSGRDEGAGVKLARRVSSLLKAPKSILKKDNQKQGYDEDERHIHLASLEDIHSKHHLEEKHIRMEQLRVRRQSLTYRAVMLRTKTVVRSSSCPDMRQQQSERVDSIPTCGLLIYLTLPFLMFCLSNSILYFWYDVPYVYTIEFAETRLKIHPQTSTQIISVIGILNTIGEVVIGWLGDRTWFPISFLYAVSMLVCGFAAAFIPFAGSYWIILVLSGVYGFFISANYSLTSPILVELVSLEKFSTAYGFLLAAQGVANLVGPVFAGWLYDYTKEWFLTFALAGVFIGFSGLMLITIPCYKKVVASYKTQRRNSTKLVTTTIDQINCNDGRRGSSGMSVVSV